MFHTYLHLHVALNRRTNERSLETFQKAVLFRKPLGVEYKSTSTLFQNPNNVGRPCFTPWPIVSTSPLLAAHASCSQSGAAFDLTAQATVGKAEKRCVLLHAKS